MSDTVLRSLEGSKVIVSAYGKGPVYIGTLRTVGDVSVVLVSDGGHIMELAKQAIEDIKLDETAPAPTPTPASPETPAPTPEGPAAPVPGQNSRVNFHFNALGVLQFGLAPSLEVGGRHFGFATRVRVMNTGLMSYFVAGRPQNDNNFVFGMGAGFAARGYFLGKGNMRGLFLGAALEYSFVRIDDSEDDLAEYRTHSIVPMGELGYRWAFNRFLLGVGISAGAAVPVAWSDEPIGSEGCFYEDSCDDTRSTFPFGLLRLDLGWMLGG